MDGVRAGEKGFTLVELSIAMAILVFAMASVYALHRTMVKSNQTVEQTASMQQNARAGIFLMAEELRLAGSDPTGKAYRDASAQPFETAASNRVHITMDIEDTDRTTGKADGLLDALDENVTYALEDLDADGDTDLVRGNANGTVIVAENIDALDFVYLDGNGAETLTKDEIRSVEVTLVARTGNETRFQADVDDAVYTNQRSDVIYTPAANDHHRRVRLAMEVRCRNMGLK